MGGSMMSRRGFLAGGMGAALMLSSCGGPRHGILKRGDDAERVDVSALTPEEAELARSEIRQALRLVFDRGYICDHIMQNGATPTSTFVFGGVEVADGEDFTDASGGSGGFFDVTEDGIPDDYADAVAILTRYYDVDEATGTMTNFPPFTYLYESSSSIRSVGEYLQEVMADLGIRMDLENQEWATYLESTARGEFQLCYWGSNADYPDPLCILEAFTSTSANNSARLGKGGHADIRAYDLDLTPYGIDLQVEGGTWAETYDVLVDTIRCDGDVERRYRLMHLAEDMVMDTGVIMPAYQSVMRFLLSKRVDGIVVNGSGELDFSGCTVDGRRDATLPVCIAPEPLTLDPGQVYSVDGSTLCRHLFSGLARWGCDEDGTLELRPDCAEELVEGVENEDGTITYTYTLREGLTWSDGVPLTAGDFEFTWRRSSSRDFAAPFRDMFSVIKGFDEGDIDVHATDDRTLVVTLKNRIPYWDALLAHASFMPVRSDVVASEDWACAPETLVGNGPYRMTGWSHDSLITMDKRPEYWNAENVMPATIEWYLSNDSNVCLRNWESGDWLCVTSTPPDESARLLKQYPDEFRSVPIMGTIGFLWNVEFDMLPK